MQEYFFNTNSERATQTGLFKGSDAITWQFFLWFTPTLFSSFNLTTNLSDGYMSRQRYI